jgi:hypothetical protein
MAATPPEISVVLEQVTTELIALAAQRLTGTVTIHCAADGYQVEVHVRHKKIPNVARKGWGLAEPRPG